MTLPELRTARLLLRSFEDGDLSPFAAMNADPRVTEYLPAVLSQDESDALVIRFGFEQLSLPEIVSFTVPHNHRSRRVMEKIGMRHDPRDDFDHPRLPEGHALRRHVLYRKRRGL